MASVGELFIKLGFDVDDAKFKSFNDEIQSGLLGLTKMSAAAAGSLYAFDKFIEGSIAGAIKLQNFNRITGLSTQELQKWQKIAVNANPAMSIDQVTASVSNLSKSLADISMGKGDAGPLSMLIGDVRGKSAFEVLEELRKNYQTNVARWGLRQTNDIISSLGIDPGMINAIQLTNDEFERLSKNAILSPQSIQNLEQLGQAIVQLETDFQTFKDQTVADWSPKIIEVIKELTPVAKEMGETIGDATELLLKLPGPAEAAAFVAFCALIAPRATALTIALSGLVAAMSEIQKMTNGEQTVTGDAYKFWKDLFGNAANSAGGLFSDSSGRKLSINDMMKNQDHPLSSIFKSGLIDYKDFLLNPVDPNGIDITNVHGEAQLDRLLGGAGGMASAPNNVTVNNNIDIHADNNPEAIGEAAGRAVQPSYNRVGAQLNNGPQY